MSPPTVIFGTFDAERTWEDPTLARLPAVLHASSNEALVAMDELLIGACHDGDVIVTHSPFVDVHREHLQKAGFSRIRFLTYSDGAFRSLAGTYRFQPWAVTPDVHALWAELRVDQPLPRPDAVARVNSKIWSAEMRRELGLFAPGEIVRTALEFVSAGEALLAENAAGIVVKEPQGVAGRGSMWIRSADRLRRVASDLSRQERDGAAVLLVVEPFLRKRYDFSTHITIAPDGTVTINGLRSLWNQGLGYLASCALSPEEFAAVSDPRHMQAIERLGEAAYGAGYFGPACVDGMVLEPDGELWSVVEVNARLSLGAISASLDNRFRAIGARTHLTSIRLSTSDAPDTERLFSLLDGERVAFDGERLPGIVVLTAPTARALSAHAGVQAGRMFVAVVHTSPQQLRQLLDRTHAVLRMSGYQVLGPRD